MPKPKIFQHKSPKASELPQQHKALQSKNKNLKFFKSIQKTQQIPNSQYLVKPPHLRQPKNIPTSKNSNFLAKLERPLENRKRMDEDYYDCGKKIYSDQQSTHANALFQSGEIYQNFINKNKPKPAQTKKQIQTKAEQKHNDKSRCSSDSKIVKELLKNKLAEFKMLQKRQEKEMQDYRLKSTTEQVYRLEKIQAIERQMMEQQMDGLQSRMKQKSDLKSIQSYLSVKKL